MQSLGPEAGGAVMATGIVSVAMLGTRQLALSRALLAITALMWAALGVAFVARWWRVRPRWRAEAARPASLTGVAGTAVLGTRLVLLGWTWAGWVLLGIAVGLCLALVAVLARGSSIGRTGASFLLVVAPQSLAVLAATLALRRRLGWPTPAALAVLLVGLLTYAVVLRRFALSQLREGLGDHWIAGGALAISTLACAQVGRAVAWAHILGGLHEALRVAGVVLWVMTMAWLPLLLASEVRWPRWSYDARRWATVFPLGMYSAMSVAVGQLAAINPIVRFGNDWAWVALAGWAWVALGAVRRARRPVDKPSENGDDFPANAGF